MNKAELIAEVHGRADVGGSIPRNAVEAVVNNALGVIREELAAGREVQLYGFGKFEAADSPARKGRNPRTGAPLRIEARRRVRFAPGKNLRQAINA